MRTRFARLLGLSAALLSLAFVGPTHAQKPANVGRQVEGEVLNNVGNAVVGQPAIVAPAQPAAPALPATPRQAVQGIERQTINNATNAITGQPGPTMSQGGSATRYQVPAQFAGSAPGTTVNYGGTNYTVNADGTMSPAAAAAQPAATATRYRIPSQFTASAPGSTVNYGGTNYVVNADRTMSPVAAVPGQPGGYGLPATPRQALQGMERRAFYGPTNAMSAQPGSVAMPAAPARRYHLPSRFTATAPGTIINYGGVNYVVNANRTMSPAGPAALPTANLTRYQIPSQFTASAPGTTVNYGGANYLINNDNTMSPFAR
jgi:hypothetical protein